MAPQVDYSGLKPGMKLQAESDGQYHPAEVVVVSDAKKRAKAPVKVHYIGYGADWDEWLGASRLRSKALKKAPAKERQRVYSLADQVARFERAKKEDNKRYLDITTVYDGSVYKGKRVLVVGSSKGVGLELVKELKKQEAVVVATTRKDVPELEEAASQVIKDVDVTSYDSMKKMCSAISEPVDYVLFVAGYFPDIKDNLDTVQDEAALQQYQIQALGPLRCVGAMKAAGLLDKKPKIIIISSQAGSTKWRFTQNKDKGGDYGHHMSRAACNMCAVLMSEELKSMEVPIVMLHPGFNRTTMTEKYSAIWDKEGAVPAEEGAKRVLYESSKVTMKSSGKFINVEDGLQIPF
eukprot:CAMPEP_0206452832 /NCGR_PEP_ID=MMETSP0324_2-20121206/20181_1 /ASSEMBLY_ACC=CAM_ASM_000836 /TAXON_ID=2866 /ORGANISM="Crypthecodinium cohnii, Strain Seligo" /LENGTH=349 /DNA_ID=CAMNT_0053922999 /DNA_START=77 /DNA_END=1126 /DNA_ORIENTATION=+